MAALGRTPLLAGLLTKLGRLSISSQLTSPSFQTSVISAIKHVRLTPCCSTFHTTSNYRGLMEFFDSEKNWGEMEVKVGRSWKVEELRIKSNEDLHKLWFVLLKEKNMLLTMEHACAEEYQLFPNPERIDKVEESMKNLENVVRERNRAYWLLETGQDGERPGAFEEDELGRRAYRKFTEHVIPIWMNPRAWKVKDVRETMKFSRLMREKKYLDKKRARVRMRNHVYMLLRRYPHMDLDVLQQKYPEVNVKALRTHKRSLGHHLHNLA